MSQKSLVFLSVRILKFGGKITFTLLLWDWYNRFILPLEP